MSRHNRAGDPEFGSDSFLDIIANIVGILIILIVVAGVKVAKQPTKVAPPPAAHASDANEATTDAVITEEEYAAVQGKADQLEEQTRTLLADAEPLMVAIAELTVDSSRLTDELSQVRQILTDSEQSLPADDKKAAAIDTRTDELNVRTLALHDEIEAARKQQRMFLGGLEQVVRRKTQAEEQLRDSSVQLAALEELILKEQEASIRDQDRLKHRLSPVATTTSEQEMHFRMRGGRITWVPLEPLLDRLKSQVKSRADIVRRFGKYEGTCGPVGGFVMKYSVERVAPSPLDALNGIQRGFRIEVSRWTVTPADTFAAESVEEALRSGSRFRQILEAADPEATITIWLYAEDFAHFHELRELAHKLDLRVAARPLPADTEISGSPGGSRSSAQ